MSKPATPAQSDPTRPRTEGGQATESEAKERHGIPKEMEKTQSGADPEATPKGRPISDREEMETTVLKQEKP
jgi:hypothetical protein